MLNRRHFLTGLTGSVALPVVGQPACAAPETWAQSLVIAAKSQIGQTTGYDPAYRKIAYPHGDVPRESGVCTDVIIRAYRQAFNMDLQKLVHEDMAQNFAAYPKIWGLKSTDTNIDHRRVPNLQRYFQRRNSEKRLTQSASDYHPGDLVTMMVNERLPHIAIVSAETNDAGTRPLLIHNIGEGAKQEDVLFAYPLTGHYRLPPHKA